MTLEAQIWEVVTAMPPKDQMIVNQAFQAILNVCAMADKLGAPDKLYGAIAVALLGARYQDMEDAVQD